MADEVKIKITAVDDASPVLKKFDSQVGSTGSNIGSFAKGAAAAFAAVAAAAVVAFGVESVKAFAKFEKTMSGVKAVLAPTAEEFKKLNDLALELGQSTSKSSSEVAEAFDMLARNGLNATQILEGAGAASLALAEATGSDLATSANIATDVMAIFKKEAKDLGKVIDGIAGVTVKSKFSIDDYALALAQGGGVAASVGVSMEDFNTSIAAISPLFASGSDAGTSFKTMMLRLNPASKEATKAMKELGIITKDGQNRFYDSEGQMQSMSEVSKVLSESLMGLDDQSKNVALSTIFGTDAMRAAVALAEVGGEGFTKLAASIAEVEAEQMAKERLNNLSGAFEQMNGAIETLMIQVGGFISLALTPLIQWTTELITVISGLTSQFITWATATETVNQANQLMGAGMEILSGVMQALQGPIEMLSNLWEGTWQLMSAKWEEFSARILPYLVSFFGYVQQLFGEFNGFVTENWDAIVYVTESTFAIIGSIIDVALSLIMTIIQVAFELISGIFGTGLAIIKGDWSGAWEIMKGTVVRIWEAISSFVVGALTTVKNTISDILGKIGIDFDGMMSKLGEAWNKFWKEIENVVKTASSGIESIVNTIKSIIGGVITTLENMINTAKRAAQSIPFVGGAFGGARAEGGPVTSGKTYLVGEQGPELFTPSSSGSIIPNNRLGGGGSTIVVNINGLVSSRDVAEQYANVIVRKLQLSTAVV